ncbi:MAG: DUF1761 domain-containing protein [Alphaproteobacteria bacterium]|nr:DUF1761 domain-containing protein [Alphaproteobacteria bacterium]
MLPHVNDLIVLLAAVLAFALGGIWYSPMAFGPAWMSAHDYTPEKMVEMRLAKPQARSMIVTSATQLLQAVVLAYLMHWVGIAGLKSGILFGLLVWAGFAATVALIANTFSDKPFKVFVIESGYQLVSITLMAAIIGSWS